MSPWVLGVLLAVGGLIVSTVVAGLILVFMPPDHFTARRKPLKGVRRITLAILKNLAGAALVLAGVVLSLPGIPGQGILTVFAGLLLLDIPGKRRLELALLRRPFVQRVIGRLRKRFKKEPLEIPARAKRGKGKSDS